MGSNHVQKCDGSSHHAKPCDANPHLLKRCVGPTGCWVVTTVTFHKNPLAISFGCNHCPPPGIAATFISVHTEADLIANVCCVAIGDIEFCTSDFLITVELFPSTVWTVIYEDDLVQVWAIMQVNAFTGSFSCGGHFPAYDAYFPHTFPDPGGHRTDCTQSVWNVPADVTAGVGVCS